MTDAQCEAKLKELQKYIPFMEDVIKKLRVDNARKEQLQKMEQLHDFLTNANKKLKLETLIKCEGVLIKLHAKIKITPNVPAQLPTETTPTLSENVMKDEKEKPNEKSKDFNKSNSTKKTEESKATDKDLDKGLKNRVEILKVESYTFHDNVKKINSIDKITTKPESEISISISKTANKTPTKNTTRQEDDKSKSAKLSVEKTKSVDTTKADKAPTTSRQEDDKLKPVVEETQSAEISKTEIEKSKTLRVEETQPAEISKTKIDKSETSPAEMLKKILKTDFDNSKSNFNVYLSVEETCSADIPKIGFDKSKKSSVEETRPAEILKEDFKSIQEAERQDFVKSKPAISVAKDTRPSEKYARPSEKYANLSVKTWPAEIPKSDFVQSKPENALVEETQPANISKTDFYKLKTSSVEETKSAKILKELFKPIQDNEYQNCAVYNRTSVKPFFETYRKELEDNETTNPTSEVSSDKQQILELNAERQHISRLLGQSRSNDKLEVMKTLMETKENKEQTKNRENEIQDRTEELKKKPKEEEQKEKGGQYEKQHEEEDDDIPSCSKATNIPSKKDSAVNKKKRSEFETKQNKKQTKNKENEFQDRTEELRKKSEEEEKGEQYEKEHEEEDDDIPSCSKATNMPSKKDSAVHKKKRSELDYLNEDINNSFICEAVLNVTGRRRKEISTKLPEEEEEEVPSKDITRTNNSNKRKQYNKPGPKPKKPNNVQPDNADDKSETESETYSETESAILQSHIKNTNIHWHNQSKYINWCMICDKSILMQTSTLHYNTHHGENYISRLPPVILHKLKQGKSSYPLFGVDRGTNLPSWFYRCPFCQNYLNTSMPWWLSHFRNHTAEFGYACSKCHKGDNNKKLIQTHINRQCKGATMIHTTIKLTVPSQIKAYICHLCNFIQMKRTNLERHYVEQHQFAKISVHLLGYTITLFNVENVELVPEDKFVEKEAEAWKSIQTELLEKLNRPLFGVDRPHTPASWFYQCPFCLKYFTKLLAWWDEHFQKHITEFRYQCSKYQRDNNRSATTPKPIAGQCKGATMIKAYVCHLCNLMQLKRDTLDRHYMEQHQLDKQDVDSLGDAIILLNVENVEMVTKNKAIERENKAWKIIQSEEQTINNKQNEEDKEENETKDNETEIAGNQDESKENETHKENENEIATQKHKVTQEHSQPCTTMPTPTFSNDQPDISNEEDQDYEMEGNYLNNTTQSIDDISSTSTNIPCSSDKLPEEKNQSNGSTNEEKPENANKRKQDNQSCHKSKKSKTIQDNNEDIQDNSESKSLPSKPKNQQQDNSETENESLQSKPNTEEQTEDDNKLIKNTNRHWHNQSEFINWCMICVKKIPANASANHYKMLHGENYTSRLAPALLHKFKQGKLSRPLFGVDKTPKQPSWFYRCPFCMQYFNTSMSLWLEHLQNHTAEFRYECSECHRGSNRADTLRKHINRQCKRAKAISYSVKLSVPTRIKGYVCHLCNFIQLKRDNLDRHFIEQHQLDNRDIDSFGYTITLFNMENMELMTEDESTEKEIEVRRSIPTEEQVKDIMNDDHDNEDEIATEVEGTKENETRIENEDDIVTQRETTASNVKTPKDITMENTVLIIENLKEKSNSTSRNEKTVPGSKTQKECNSSKEAEEILIESSREEVGTATSTVEEGDIESKTYKDKSNENEQSTQNEKTTTKQNRIETQKVVEQENHAMNEDAVQGIQHELPALDVHVQERENKTEETMNSKQTDANETSADVNTKLQVHKTTISSLETNTCKPELQTSVSDLTASFTNRIYKRKSYETDSSQAKKSCLDKRTTASNVFMSFTNENYSSPTKQIFIQSTPIQIIESDGARIESIAELTKTASNEKDEQLEKETFILKRKAANKESTRDISKQKDNKSNPDNSSVEEALIQDEEHTNGSVYSTSAETQPKQPSSSTSSSSSFKTYRKKSDDNDRTSKANKSVEPANKTSIAKSKAADEELTKETSKEKDNKSNPDNSIVEEHNEEHNNSSAYSLLAETSLENLPKLSCSSNQSKPDNSSVEEAYIQDEEHNNCSEYSPSAETSFETQSKPSCSSTSSSSKAHRKEPADHESISKANKTNNAIPTTEANSDILNDIVRQIMQPNADRQHILGVLEQILSKEKFELVKILIETKQNKERQTNKKDESQEQTVESNKKCEEEQETGEQNEEDHQEEEADDNIPSTSKVINIHNKMDSTLNKKKRNEVERLNEDIREMFICQDVQAIMGQTDLNRSLRNLKTNEIDDDDDESTAESNDSTVTDIYPQRKISIVKPHTPMKLSEDDTQTAQTTKENTNIKIKRKQKHKSGSKSKKAKNVPNYNEDIKDNSLSETEGESLQMEPKTQELDKSLTKTKNTNINWHSQSKYINWCIVCAIKLHANMSVNHYMMDHGENYISRLSPVLLENFKQEPKLCHPLFGVDKTPRKPSWFHRCPFCLDYLNVSMELWLNHLRNHTAEFRFKCSKCSRGSNRVDVIAIHIKRKCKRGTVINSAAKPTRYALPLIKAHVCHLCNFIQLDRENLERHYIEQHQVDNRNVDSFGYQITLFDGRNVKIVSKDKATERVAEAWKSIQTEKQVVVDIMNDDQDNDDEIAEELDESKENETHKNSEICDDEDTKDTKIFESVPIVTSLLAKGSDTVQPMVSIQTENQVVDIMNDDQDNDDEIAEELDESNENESQKNREISDDEDTKDTKIFESVPIVTSLLAKGSDTVQPMVSIPKENITEENPQLDNTTSLPTMKATTSSIGTPDVCTTNNSDFKPVRPSSTDLFYNSSSNDSTNSVPPAAPFKQLQNRDGNSVTLDSNLSAINSAEVINSENHQTSMENATDFLHEQQANDNYLISENSYLTLNKPKLVLNMESAQISKTSCQSSKEKINIKQSPVTVDDLPTVYSKNVTSLEAVSAGTSTSVSILGSSNLGSPQIKQEPTVDTKPKLDNNNYQSNVHTVNPINFVPRLFDLHTNLVSSYASPLPSSSSSPQTNSNLPTKSVFKIPYSYVFDPKRFKCGCPDCNYDSIFEDIFRKHLSTHHINAKKFRCQFCHQDICKRGITIDRIVNHLRFHSATIYRCDECNYLHHKRDVVRRHINEKHATLKVNIVTHERSSEDNAEGTTSVMAVKGKQYTDISDPNQQPQTSTYNTNTSFTNNESSITNPSSLSSKKESEECRKKLSLSKDNDDREYDDDDEDNEEPLIAKTNYIVGYEFVCFHCNFKTQRLDDLKTQHYQKVHNTPPETAKPFWYYLQKRLCCPECRQCIGKSSELQKHLLHVHKTNLYYAADITIADTDDTLRGILCGYCSFQCLTVEELHTHYRSIHHKPQDFHIDSNEHIMDILKLCKSETSFICTTCTDIFPNAVAIVQHACSDHPGDESSFEELSNCLMFRCAHCIFTSTTEIDLLRHMIDHYDRFKMCNFCYKPQVTFNDYMQHWYAEHKNVITRFKDLYPYAEIQKYLSHMLIIFPSGLVLRKRNLLTTEYGGSNAIEELYEEIYKISQQPPIPRLSIARLVARKSRDAAKP